ncbi:MAG: hypothetical protein AAFV88_04420 [Planctomycetota bacterium]
MAESKRKIVVVWLVKTYFQAMGVIWFIAVALMSSRHDYDAPSWIVSYLYNLAGITLFVFGWPIALPVLAILKAL